MKNPVTYAAAVFIISAAFFIPSHPVSANELSNTTAEASDNDTEEIAGISATEKAVSERIEAEKSAIETAYSGIEQAAEINRFTSDQTIADRILAEKKTIAAAREDIEKAAEYNKEKEYSDIVESMPDHTYIDINLTSQTLTYYINGGVTMVSDIVSGNVSRNCDTPQGVYQIYGKQKSRTLRGPNYEAYVNYWMPFKGNYGIHDATWRSSFGGDIYQTNGSHGCVNISKTTAAILYETAPVGTRVFVHL